MPVVDADWSFTRSTGDLRYIGDDHGGASPSYATVIEMHRWVQDKLDDEVYSGDDQFDITLVNASSRSTDNIIAFLNGVNIDDASSEHLYDGSIIQNGGDDIYDGIVNFGVAGIAIQIIQNGVVLADDWWNSNGGLNADSTQGISHRFMLKVRSGGVDIDGRRLIGTSREFGKTYTEFSINGTSRGNNVLALTNATDLNNATVEATVATWTGITNLTEGYNGLDVDNNGADEFYYSQWDLNIYSINDFFERMKWLTRDGSSSTLYGLNGELFRGITHEINIDTNTGTFNAFEPVSWSGGTAQMLAINSTTAGTKMWIQLLTGVPPTDGQVITGGTSSATCAVNVTVTSRPISIPFVGASTGSAIIGSYGLGIDINDLSASDKLFDLTNTQITPPNNVTNTVAGLVSGEDRVLVFPWDGSTLDPEGNPAIDEDQLTLSTSLTGAAETSVVVTTSIPADTPATGWIRIQTNSGKYVSVAYTSWTGSTFTIVSTDFSGDNATNPKNVWIAYLDKLAGATSESFTGVFTSSRNLGVLVRDGGGTPIKQFISAWSFSSSNSTITAIRTSDE